MPTRVVVLPVRPVRSGQLETFGLNLKVLDVVRNYGDVAKVRVEGAAGQLDAVDGLRDALYARERAEWQAAQAARATAQGRVPVAGPGAPIAVAPPAPEPAPEPAPAPEPEPESPAPPPARGAAERR